MKDLREEFNAYVLDLEYLGWCLSELTPCQFVIYQVCTQLEGKRVTTKELAELTKVSFTRVRDCLHVLHKKGFVILFSRPSLGTTVLWVRRFKRQRYPSEQQLAELKGYAYRATDPFGVPYLIAAGQLKRFCHTHGLRYDNMNSVVSGRRQTHQGWRISRIKRR